MVDTKQRIHVGVIFGGRSGEHEISLRSARSVVEAMDRDKYRVSLIGIDHNGGWHLLPEAEFDRLTGALLPSLDAKENEITLVPAPARGELVDLKQPDLQPQPLDVVFPVLHGPYGEDGSIQGLLELADVPYVGAGVTGSAIGMDKDVQKRLLAAAGLPLVPFRTVRRRQWETDRAQVLESAGALDLPVFVKPANLGSSVGISKVKTPEALTAAIETALLYDDKLVIERGVAAREIECAVLGNEDPEASVPGEICPHADFYSYEAKYVDERGATLRIPAPLSPAQTEQVRSLAVEVFRVLDCDGMARVDFFLERDTEKLYVNELNSIPGFTSISMYPKMWEASGLAYGDLIDRLIELALQRHERRARLKKAYVPLPAGSGA
jgi:D-alanine-D-alanine ligase